MIESHTILLRSGTYFNFLSPEESQFTINDIAHALSNLCRFNGHCRRFYSVAQHSVLVSQNLPRELRYQGLMHDATEAFIGDVTKPLKALLPDFQAIERRIEAAVCKRLGLPLGLDPEVKQMDLRALLTEQRDLMRSPDEWPCLRGLTPFDKRIVPVTQAIAKALFMQHWNEVSP